MNGELWWIWLIIAAVFIIGEIFTAGFFLFWFGLGAIVACILAIIGLGPAWQWGSFIVISGVLFAVSRRFAEKFTKKQPPGIGADRLIDKTGIVLETIDNDENTGLVRIGKEEWRAESDSGMIIPESAKVKVERVDGTHLIVKIYSEEG
ncbi:NfeD family protein [bacterium]|nr:NfeD family protein [bacterium]